MKDFQAEKQLVLDFYNAIYSASPETLQSAGAKFVTDDYTWTGMHPFDAIQGWNAVAETFYKPLKQAAAEHCWTRRPDMFFAGINEGTNSIAGDKTTWVVEMGHMVFFFEKPWLNIPANDKVTFLRYVDFHRVENGKIAETKAYCDILQVMQQAGINPLQQTGADIINPGPANHNGLKYNPSQNPAEGIKTRKLVNDMIEDLVDSGMSSPMPHLKKFWHPNMFWFGPCGIGGSGGTLDGYWCGHSGPFAKQLEYVDYYGEPCFICEDDIGGFFGYPNLTMRNTGGYMGIPANDKNADMRLVDLYRRDGDKLAENWIFIDMLYFLYMQGHDLLGDLPSID